MPIKKDEKNFENEVRELLLYHKIIRVDKNNNMIVLDNGTQLTFIGNEGCNGCGSGGYDITVLNGCENIITDVKIDIDWDTVNSKHYDISYKIYVYTEDKRIKLMQADGRDGNCCYGSGYDIYVKRIKDTF